MSRRREAADLARVLALSTQEAAFALENSPHTLSSPRDTGKGSNTDDSREMEMRPVHPGVGVDPRLLMRPPGSSANPGGSHASSSQSGTGSGSGSGNGGRSTIEPVQSTVQRTGISTIQPFTPSASAAPNSAFIPESSGIPLPNAQQPPPQHTSSVPSSAQRTGVSSTEKSQAAEASGPLFSPTQGSRRNLMSDMAQPEEAGAGVEVSPPRPAVRHQYSRIAPVPAIPAATTPVVPEKVGSTTRPYQLSSSPDIPTRAQPAPRPVKRSRAVLSDNEEDERPAPAKTPLPRRLSTDKADNGVPVTSESGRSGRRESPDPLLIGPSRGPSKSTSRQVSSASIPPIDTPTNPKKTTAAKPKAKPRTSSAAKTKGKEKEKEKWADNEKEIPEDSEAPKRISSRVREQQAKEEAEKLERRRKRAEEKERQAKEVAMRMAAAAKLGGAEGEGPEVIEIVDDEDEEAGPAQEVQPAREEVQPVQEEGKGEGKGVREREREPVRSVEVEHQPEVRPAEAKPQPEAAKTPVPESSAPKAASKKSTVRKRVLSSSPAPTETIIAIVPPHPAAEVTRHTPPAVEDEQPAPPRAASIDPAPEPPAEAGPSKPTSAKRPPAKKTATQSKKATAAAAKKAAAATAKKEKAAAKVVPKSKEMVESDEDEDMEPTGAAGGSKAAGKEKAGPNPKSREFIESDEDEDAGREKSGVGPSRSRPEAEAEEVVPPPKAKSPVAPKRPPPARRGSPETSPDKSPAKDSTPARPPLTAVPSRIANFASSSTPRHSPGPMSEKGTPLRPDGIKFKTERNDLASVLSKFPTSKFSGMSRRLKIAPLHSKIGPPKKELPPPPKKAEKRKKGESDDEDEDEEEEEDEDGVMRKKKKERGMEWYMVED